MSFWDKWSGGSRDQIGKYAWAVVIAVLKETGEIGLAEFSAGLDEYRKERKTPDGWTEEEYLTYAIGRLKLIEQRKIGPWYVDEALDFATRQLIGYLEGKIEHIDDEVPLPPEEDDEPIPAPAPVPAPVPQPTPTPLPEPQPQPVPVPVPVPAPAPGDYYYPVTFDTTQFPPMERLIAGDRVYKYLDSSVRFVVPYLGEQFPLYRKEIDKATLIFVKENKA